MPRKKKDRYTRIAKQIECLDEYCGPCGYCQDKPHAGLCCDEFHRQLAPLGGSRRAERCSDCHLAERLANGEDVS